MNKPPYTRGFAILYAVLTASLVLSIGLAIFNITLKEFTLSSQVRDSQFAFYAADTGLECALYWDLEHPGYSGSLFGAYTNTLSNGLVGYWKFDEGTGMEARDTSGRGNHGELIDTSEGTWDPTDKVIGNSLDFDGADDYVRVPHSSSLTFPDEITIAAWIKAPPLGVVKQVVSKDNTTTRVWQFRIASNNTIQLIVFGSDGLFGAWNSTTVVADNDWHHVAGTWDGSDIRIYVDGDEEPAGAGYAGSFVKTQSTDLTIGVADNGAGQFFNGHMDEVRVYNRVLEDSEIEDLATLTTSGGFYIPQNADNIICNGMDISDGWIQTEPDIGAGSATTTFTVEIGGGNERCVEVTVAKASGLTRIVSRGYNTCDPDNSRRIERAIRATY